MPRAVVLVIDGLGAKHLGPYGNTWLETPAFNHLAAESLVMDNVYAPFADRWASLDSMWRGKTAIAQDIDVLQDANFISWLNAKSITTQLVTDDSELVDQKLVSEFAFQGDIEVAPGIKLASEWDETHSASFFAQAVNAVEQLPENSLLWLHTRGLGNPWDAPYEFRSQFAHEEDPEPSGSSQVPSLQLDEGYDPDALHEIQCAMAGQVVLLDQCIGVMLSVIRDLPDDLLFVVTSLRGFPLGEHLQVGWERESLYHELLHVPAFIRYPDGTNAMRRSRQIHELSDITTSLMRWFGAESTDATPTGNQPKRQFSLSRTDDEVLLRTPTWQLRFPESVADESQPPELYLKPDDQNEVNNVASRCEDVVVAGRDFIQQLQRADGPKPELPEVLLEPAD